MGRVAKSGTAVFAGKNLWPRPREGGRRLGKLTGLLSNGRAVVTSDRSARKTVYRLSDLEFGAHADAELEVLSQFGKECSLTDVAAAVSGGVVEEMGYVHHATFVEHRSLTICFLWQGHYLISQVSHEDLESSSAPVEHVIRGIVGRTVERLQDIPF